MIYSNYTLALIILFNISTIGLSIQPLSQLKISDELKSKMYPFPTVAYIPMKQIRRVGAQRYKQFGTRCWHMEACDECVCCGTCNNTAFACNSPPGSLDYCKLYEYISAFTDFEKQTNDPTRYKFPDDFPIAL